MLTELSLETASPSAAAVPGPSGTAGSGQNAGGFEGGLGALLSAASDSPSERVEAAPASAEASDASAAADQWLHRVQGDFAAMHPTLDSEESGVVGSVTGGAEGGAGPETPSLPDEALTKGAYLAPVPVPLPVPSPRRPPVDAPMMGSTADTGDPERAPAPSGGLAPGGGAQASQGVARNPALMAYAIPIPVPIPAPFPGQPTVDAAQDRSGAEQPPAGPESTRSPTQGGSVPDGFSSTRAAQSTAGTRFDVAAVDGQSGAPAALVSDGASSTRGARSIPGTRLDVAGVDGQSGAPAAPVRMGSAPDHRSNPMAPSGVEPAGADSARPGGAPIRDAARGSLSSADLAIVRQQEPGESRTLPAAGTVAALRQSVNAALGGAAIDARVEGAEAHAASSAPTSGQASTPDERGRESQFTAIRELAAQAASGNTVRAEDSAATSSTASPALVGATSAAARPAVVEGMLMPQRAGEAAVPGGENVGRLIEAMRVQWHQGAQEASIRLSPQHFGEVTMSIRVDKGMVTAVIHAETPAVQQWLESQEERLRSGLSDQGLNLEKLTVQRDRPQQRREPQRQAPPRKHAQPGDAGERFDVLV